MIRRLLTLVLAVVVIATLAVVGCAKPVPTPTPAPSTVEPIKITCASWEAPEGDNNIVIKMWADELKEKTHGKVEVDIASGAVMAKPDGHYDLAVNGIADMSLVGLPYTPGYFPMIEICELPLTGPFSADLTIDKMNEALWKLYEKGYFDDEFKDTKVLWIGITLPSIFLMGKGNAIKSFADFNGKKVRCSGKWHIEIVEALGGIPVGLPPTEVYSSLQKGVIDGAYAEYSFINAFRIEDILGSVTEEGISGMHFAIVMNKDFFASLPEDVQDVINEISPKYHTILADIMTEFTNIGKQLALDAGCEVYQLSEEDREKVDEAMLPIWKAWFAEGESKGLPRKQIADECYKMLQDMGVTKPFHGYEP